MRRLPRFLAVALSAGALLAQAPPSTEIDELQPGILRVSGLSDSDRLLLDGELVGDGKRLAQFGSQLMINPGEYTVTILRANLPACRSRVRVRENSTVTARCANPAQTADEVEVD